MIKGFCRTNLDDYRKYRWPTLFVEVPRIGDRVQSLCGLHNLKVCSITHQIKSNTIPDINLEPDTLDSYPCICIELNK